MFPPCVLVGGPLPPHIEGAFLSARKERGSPPHLGIPPSDLGHRNTGTGGQRGPRTSCSATLNSHSMKASVEHQGGEGAHAQLPGQGGLADQDPGERRCRVHLGVGHEPQFLELVGLQEVGLVDDEHDGAVPFGGLGGEQVRGLGHQLGFEVARLGAERTDDLHVSPRVPKAGLAT